MLPMLQPELWTPVAWVDEIEPPASRTSCRRHGNTRLERRGSAGCS
jgi:hypothetical protein